MTTSHPPAAPRGPRNPVDPWTPVAFLTEPECAPSGRVEDVATLFLANSECPFDCVFCDLWKNTLPSPTPPGAAPRQIERALRQPPPARHIKLYNSGNFFDPRAIPREDRPAIAALVRSFETVIVENHPRLCGAECLAFRDLIAPAELEVAMGLETIHPDVLPRLNKQMTLEDFARAARFLTAEHIAVRAFVLLQPPFMPPGEGVDWALRSVEFALEEGARCVSVIPTRGGTDTLDQLQSRGEFTPPTLPELEHVLQTALGWRRGRIFADLWDAERFGSCAACTAQRLERLRRMNLEQRPIPPVDCPSCGGRGSLDGAAG